MAGWLCYSFILAFQEVKDTGKKKKKLTLNGFAGFVSTVYAKRSTRYQFQQPALDPSIML